MNQSLYAHMNNKRKMKRKKKRNFGFKLSAPALLLSLKWGSPPTFLQVIRLKLKVRGAYLNRLKKHHCYWKRQFFYAKSDLVLWIVVKWKFRKMSVKLVYNWAHLKRISGQTDWMDGPIRIYCTSKIFVLCDKISRVPIYSPPCHILMIHQFLFF
jgi:hypothetical protein